MRDGGPGERVVIGRVARPHGLLGEVAVDLATDFPERFTPGLALELRSDGGASRAARIETVRPHGGRVLIRFEGVGDAAAAEGLRGLDLCVGPEDLPPRPDGFVFHWEVQGCAAVDREGRTLGTIEDLVDMGGLPLLVVATPRGAREVPFSRPIVVDVDLGARRIVLDPPAGLLD